MISLEDALAAPERLSRSGLICFCERLPESLKGYLPNAKVVLSGYVLNKVMARVQTEDIIHPHGLTAEQIEAVRKAILSPVAIIRSDDRVVLFTRAMDDQNKMILVALAKDDEKNRSYVASIYGKKNPLIYLYNQAFEGNIAYLDERQLLEVTADLIRTDTDYRYHEDAVTKDMMGAAIHICEIYRAHSDVDSLQETQYIGAVVGSVSAARSRGGSQPAKENRKAWTPKNPPNKPRHKDKKRHSVGRR